MKKIIIIIIVLVALTPLPVFAQNIPPPGQAPGQRPLGCGDRCALISDGGYTIALWNKEGGNIYTYAAISHWTPTWLGAGRYIYKRTDGFYALIGYEPESGYPEGDTVIIIPAQISVYKHFKIGEHDLSIAAWDDTPTLERNYPIIKEDAFPPTGVGKDNKRYSFRIGIAGTVKLESSSGTPLANTTVMLYLDDPKGPPIMEVQTNADGTFLIAKDRSSGDEMWLNQNNIKKIFLYARTEMDGKKFDNCGDGGQGIPALNFPNDFRPNEKYPEEAKVIENVQLTLKETPEFCRTDRKQLTPGQEITGGDKNWVENAINWIKCVLRNAFINILQWEANAMGWFLRRNY